jgi:hypothetical protein
MALRNGDADTSRILGDRFRWMMRDRESMNDSLKLCRRAHPGCSNALGSA